MASRRRSLRRRWSCRAGSSWSMLPLGVLALWVLARAAGPVLLFFIAAGDRRADPQPACDVLPARAALPRPRGRGGLLRLLRVPGPGGLPARPTRWRTRPQSFQRDVPGIIDSANQQPGRPAELARQARASTSGQGAGRDGAADAAGQGRRQAPATSCRSAATSLKTLVTAGFALILVFILSVYMLIYGERIGEVVRSRHAAGRRHAGGRLPDARAARRRAATSAGSCCSAWRWAPAPALGLYIFGVARDLPRRQDVRVRVRRRSSASWS